MKICNISFLIILRVKRGRAKKKLPKLNKCNKIMFTGLSLHPYSLLPEIFFSEYHKYVYTQNGNGLRKPKVEKGYLDERSGKIYG